jgi:hypothetical protein
MHTFFHGWRRKMGVGSLVMACVLMGMWMRSYGIRDVVWIYPHRTTLHWLASSNGRFEWMTIQSLDGDLTGDIHNRWRTYPLTAPMLDARAPDANTTKRSKWAEPPTSDSRSLHIIPYWSLVLPLTLLSAYLILRKPRKRV